MITSLIEKLSEVKDFRRNRGKRHPLWKVLLAIILGIMSGHLGYRGLGDFVQVYRESLINILTPVAGRLPSYSTIRRVMMGVDCQELISKFNDWAYENYAQKDELDWLAVDGKSLKSTVINCRDSQQNFVSVVSMFSQTTGWVVRLGAFENKKGSETQKVQDMVRDCALEGKVFTGDALHCNLPLVRTILATNNNYLMTLKENQKTLYNRAKKLESLESNSSTYVSSERSHGREITRQTEVLKNSPNPLKTWAHLQSFIKVERSGWRESKIYQKTAYYVSNLSEVAQIFAQKIQGHWGIENKLHWSKDVIFKEDDSLITQFQAATNLSTLRTVGLNLFKTVGFTSAITGKRWLANPKSQLFLIFSEFGCSQNL